MAQIPQPAPDHSPYDHAVARLAGIGDELRRADAFGGGPAPDRIVGAAVAGLDALIAIEEQGSAEASRELVERIRRELAEISGVAFR